MQDETAEKLFLYGMWWRIGYGFLRIILGFIALNIVGLPLIDVLQFLMSHELGQDPNDVIYTFAAKILMNHPVYITYFLPLYFIFWGTVDIVLSYNLIKHRLWAFPISLLLMTGFFLYEIIRFTHTHSYLLLCVMAVDVFVILMVLLEFKRLRGDGTVKG